jgi:hypothetical protein
VGQRGFDVVLVHKSGPVQSMTFKSWWIYFLFFVLIIMLLGLGAAGYLLYMQQQTITGMAEDTHAMKMRVERLEAFAQKEETMQALANRDYAKPAPGKKKNKPNPAPKINKKEPKPQPKPAARAVKPLRPKPEASKPEPLLTGTETAITPLSDRPETAAVPPAPAQPAGTPANSAQNPAPTDQIQAGPTTSDRVAIRKLRYWRNKNRFYVRFRMANARKANDPAIGYTTVVLRGQRAKKVWVEAWPPMRLTPLGRPVNHRKGTPFSVQYYRKVTARFSVDDKKFKHLEILVYSRKGKLLLIHNQDIKLKKSR